MRTVTRTIYGNAIQTALYKGESYNPPENCTLNERFGILVESQPNDNDRQEVNCMVIGNGGHKVVTTSEDIASTTPLNHSAKDASCFKPLPFVVRALGDDISSTEREKYALRTTMEKDGTTYIVYWGKRVDFSNSQVGMYDVEVVDGTSSEPTPFTPTSSNLYPEPQDLDGDSELITTDGNYVQSSSFIEIEFTANDAAELVNAAEILYGDPNLAIISEIGLVAAVDMETVGPGDGGVQITYNEVIVAQIAVFIASYYQLNLQNNGFSFTADVGVASPLFAIQSSDTV